MRAILRRQLEIVVANEDGVRRDLDTEPLHDFRVAIRRSRVALGGLGAVLPADSTQHLRRELAWLGRTSGATRDLHVLLERFSTLTSALDPPADDELRLLRAALERRAGEAHRQLVGNLDSPRYPALLTAWRHLTDGEGKPDTDGTPSLEELIDRAIRKAHDKVLHRSRAVILDSHAEKLHRLRIACKKLRYLLEFFRDLYPPDEIGTAVGELKRLQSRLGAINDLAAADEILAEIAGQRGGSALRPGLIARLRTLLADRIRHEHRRIVRRLAELA